MKKLILKRSLLPSLALMMISAITLAQDNSGLNKLDSLRAEILKRLNDETLEFGFVDHSYNDQWMRPVKINAPIAFSNNQIILNTNRGDKSVSFNDTIIFVEGPKSTWINIGDSLVVVRHGKNRGILKNDYILFKEYQNKYIIESIKINLADFQKLAAGYHSRSEKPVQSEEQRKYIVQANSYNQEKDYYKAIGLYEKAVRLDPVGYPAAYYNMALLNAQVKNYRYAILNMKKYLLLAPDAPDARSAQDKIYEWELKL